MLLRSLCFCTLILRIAGDDAPPLQVAKAAEDCSVVSDASCTPLVGTLFTMSEYELDPAEEEDEAALMQVQLLQTSQLQRRTFHVASSGKEITSQGEHLAASDTKTGKGGNFDQKTSTKAQQKVVEIPEIRHPLADTTELALGDVILVPHRTQDISPSKQRVALVEEATIISNATWLTRMVATKVATLPLLHVFAMTACLVAVIVQLLVCFGVLKPFRKPFSSKKHVSQNSDVRSFVQQVVVASSLDLETDKSPSGSSGNVLAKAVSSGRPVRLEVKIEGAFDRSLMHTPLTQKSCVMYSAMAKCQGESIAIANDARQSDFIVSLVDAPWIKVLVSCVDVLCFDMQNGLWRHSENLVSAPEVLKAFVVANMNPDCLAESPSSENDAKKIDFEECSLLVGSIVTLVGKLCQSPSGQMILQPWEVLAQGSFTCDCSSAFPKHPPGKWHSP